MKPRPVKRQRLPRHTSGRLTALASTPESIHIQDSVADELALHYDACDLGDDLDVTQARRRMRNVQYVPPAASRHEERI